MKYQPLTRNIVLYTILILLAATSCQKPQGFDYRDVRNIKIDNIGFDKTALSMDLVYYNPNGFGVDLRKVDCDIYIDKNYLGKYTLDTLMHIQRRSEFVLPSRMSIDMKGVFKNLFTTLFNKEITLDVKGTTRVGKGGIYVNVPFTYSGKHNFSLFQ
jgi:LEA14-like dessication related protein